MQEVNCISVRDDHKMDTKLRSSLQNTSKVVVMMTDLVASHLVNSRFSPNIELLIFLSFL